MTTENLALFQALGAKMDYLNQKQRIIAQNIANANTPGYQPKTLKELDFDAVLKAVESNNGAVRMERTNAGHMPAANKAVVPKPTEQRATYEVTPDGNAVIMEEQLINSQKNQMDYNMMANLYQKHVSMIKIALGKQ